MYCKIATLDFIKSCFQQWNWDAHQLLGSDKYVSYLHLIHSHYSDVIMSGMASQIIGVLIVYSTVSSGADKWKHQNSAPLVRGIHRWPVNSPHKGPATRKMYLFGDVIMQLHYLYSLGPWLCTEQVKVNIIIINNFTWTKGVLQCGHLFAILIGKFTLNRIVFWCRLGCHFCHRRVVVLT